MTATNRITNAIIIAGHSHARTLVEELAAHEALPGLADHARDDVYLLRMTENDRVFGLHSPWPRPDEYWRALIDYADTNTIALLWQGNVHNSAFLIEQSPRFDFVPRGLAALPLEDGAVVVPEALVRAKLLSRMDHRLPGLLAALKARGGPRVALVATPPPKRDNEYIRSVLAFELKSIERPPNVPDHQLRPTSPLVRLKLWHVALELCREQAAAAGAQFVEVPDLVTDELGFLKPQFWYSDVTHANPAYGRIMVNYLAEKL